MRSGNRFIVDYINRDGDGRWRRIRRTIIHRKGEDGAAVEVEAWCIDKIWRNARQHAMRRLIAQREGERIAIGIAAPQRNSDRLFFIGIDAL